MKIAIMGAGAVGCYYGAMLSMAGHEVTLIGRPALVQAVRKDGLVLEKAGQRHVCKVQVSEQPDAVSGAQMVLFCVKSGDTASAGRQIAPFLRPDVMLLSLQNGISNPEVLAQETGHCVIGSVVYVASGMAAPGVVKHFGRGDLAIGGDKASEAADILNAADIETLVSADVMGLLWSKLVVNCAYNALSAVTRLPYGPLCEGEGIPGLLDDIVAECLAVAQAEGVQLPAETIPTVKGVPRWMPDQFSSTAQDVMRSRSTEIDYLNGEIVRRALKHGVPAPLNRMLTALVKLAEPAESLGLQ